MSEKCGNQREVGNSVFVCQLDACHSGGHRNMRGGYWSDVEPEDHVRDAEIAAAEERGRRRGVEERDELRAALIEVRENHALAGDDPFNTQLCWRCSEKWPCSTARTIDAALAPRDSAPADWRDDADKLIEKLKPRDSGKEGDELMRALRDSATVSTRPPPERK